MHDLTPARSLRTYFPIGVALSVAWLAIAATVLYFWADWKASMPANAIGDVFAGVAAPMAFLWLVLGFLQQGEELRLSSRALLLQVDELRQTVEQQRQLVEVTREQAEAADRREKEGALLRRRFGQPQFSLQLAGKGSGVGGTHSYGIKFVNGGSLATDVQLSFGEPHRWQFPTMGTNSTCDLNILMQATDPPPETVTATISYIDREGTRRECQFQSASLRRGEAFTQTKPPDLSI